MKKSLFLKFFLLMVFFIPLFAVEELSKYEIMAYRVKPTVVKVMSAVIVDIVYLENNAKMQERTAEGGGGSGFIINPDGYIVTNGHVVEIIYNYDQDKEKVLNSILIGFVFNKLNQSGAQLTPQNFEAKVKEWIENHKPQIVREQSVRKVFISNGDVYDYEIKKYSPSILKGGKDISIIKIEAHDLPVIILGSSDDVKLQQLVFPVGYPAPVEADMHQYLGEKTSLEVTITRGTVSALKVDYKGVPVIQTDATITHGNSGGPACDENGLVIGVSTFGSTAPDPFTGKLTEVAGFNFLVPIDTAKEFINDAGVKYNILSKFNEKYNAALDAVWSKRWFDARELITSALVFLPNQPDMIKLRQYVEGRITEMNWFEVLWAKNKIAVIIFFMIIVVATFAIFNLFAARRRPVIERVAARKIEMEKVAPEPAPVFKPGKTFGTLTVKIGEVEVGKYTIGEKGLVIGRDSEQAQIVINEPVVSKVHCMILPEKENVVLIDRGSTNGTFLNGIKIEKAYLKDGDTISLGQKGQVLITFKK